MRYPIDAICNFSDRKRNLCQDYCCEPETTNEPLERDELTRQEQEEYRQSMYDDLNDSENHEWLTEIANELRLQQWAEKGKFTK